VFEETRIFDRRFKFEDLLAMFFRRAVADAAAAKLRWWRQCSPA